jgi:hypothetical protein
MAFKLPGFGGKEINIKEDMQRKYGTGEYARGGKKFEERMKPGESKYQYDVRMRKTNKAVETITSGQEIRGLELVPKEKIGSRFSADLDKKWDPLTRKFESTFDPSNINLNVSEIKYNPGDLRPQSKENNIEEVGSAKYNSNIWGITDDMPFKEAFSKATKAGAKEGEIFEWGGEQFLYKLK